MDHESPLTVDDLVDIGPELIDPIEAVLAAMKKDSPGGSKVTKAEALDILAEILELAPKIIKEIRD